MVGSICYVMPSLYPSGGNKMIIEHVKRLAKRGHITAVSIVSRHKDDDPEWLLIDGIKIVPFDKESLEPFGHVVATYWETYYHIRNLKLVNPQKHYFVQSKEEDFEGDWFRKQQVLTTFMDKTFHLFTEAKWIKEYLDQTFHRTSTLVPNNIDLPKDLVTEKAKRNKPIILIEGEATTWWKNIDFGARVARQLRPEFDVWLLTNTPYSKISPLVFGSFDKTFSGVSWKEALELIAQADVLYRPSLLEGFNGAASEAMLLGTPTVLNNIPATSEMGINEWNTMIVRQNDLSDTLDKIKRLIVDKELYERVRVNGIETAKKQFSNWDKSIDTLEFSVFCE